METSFPPHPPIDLAKPPYYQVVTTLTGLLPPPLDHTPAALSARNRAAIAKVAALLPINANEADLAPSFARSVPSFACSVPSRAGSLAQCIAVRAEAEDMLRLRRHNAGDIGLMMPLNAQYGSTVRTSLTVHARLMRVQALRQKRKSIDGAANQDAWTQHVAEQSMRRVVNPDAAPFQRQSPKGARAQSSEGARAKWPKAAPTEPPAVSVDQSKEQVCLGKCDKFSGRGF